MSLLPNDPDIRKYINDAIKEAVVSKVRQDFEKIMQADLAETVERKTGMKKVEFNKRVALRFQQEITPTKYDDAKEWFDVVFEENELLKGSK